MHPTASRFAAVHAWVGAIADHLRPATIHWCDGGEGEIRALEQRMVEDGVLVRLDPDTHPGCFVHRSAPTELGYADASNFIACADAEDAGPTNQWMSPRHADRLVWPLFTGAMEGRTMYVVPYLLGPRGSKHSRVGIEVTDSAYVVAALRVLTRMGRGALEQLGESDEFVRGVDALGERVAGNRVTVHLPGSRAIWSIGSGRGTSAVLSKESHALRIASVEARDEGWLAEHMCVLAVTSPEGRRHYVAAAMPRGCGKTALSTSIPALPGWKVQTVSDDVAWMRVGHDGRLWAVNPEAGMLGLARGTTERTQRRSLRRDVLYSDVAVRADGSPWWEGLGPPPREGAVDWRGQPWTPESGRPAAHPDARFAVPMRLLSDVDPDASDPDGVPISAILFGGRRSSLAPLVREALDWRHGVYLGATLMSEDAEAGGVDDAHHDPMGMARFCGYNMGDYFRHWLAMGRRLLHRPKIFEVNWFRTSPEGRWLWPGFGDNVRVLKWIVDRVDGAAAARETPIGLLPPADAVDAWSMDLSPSRMHELLAVDVRGWVAQAHDDLTFLQTFARQAPFALRREQREFVRRLTIAQRSMC